MAADLSEFLTLSNPRKTTCPVEPVLSALSGAQRAQLEAALAADVGVITNVAISQWLASRGHVVKWQRIRPHRRGECSCG